MQTNSKECFTQLAAHIAACSPSFKYNELPRLRYTEATLPFLLFALNYLAHAFHLPWIAAVNLVLLRRAA